MMEKAEKVAEQAVSQAMGAMGSLTGESKEETEKKKKSVMQGLRDGIKGLFKKGSTKADKGKKTATVGEPSGADEATDDNGAKDNGKPTPAKEEKAVA